MKNKQVNLETTWLKTKESKVTGPYERESLEKWLQHAKDTSSDDILSWKILEI